MKFFALTALALLPLMAHADEQIDQPPALSPCSYNNQDISKDPAAIVAAISKTEFCWEAVQLAENCGSNVGGDVAFVAAAAPICQKEFQSHNPTAQDTALLNQLRATCDAHWKNKEGSQYQSINSYCKIRAWLWMVNLTSENKR